MRNYESVVVLSQLRWSWDFLRSITLLRNRTVYHLVLYEVPHTR